VRYVCQLIAFKPVLQTHVYEFMYCVFKSSTCSGSMFIILSWFSTIFDLIEFALRNSEYHAFNSNIYCTTFSVILV
jgi:hypothetical protein